MGPLLFQAVEPVMAGVDALESVAQPLPLRRVEPRRGGPEVALVLVAMREMSGSEAALWTTQHVVQIATIEHELFTVVDERALEREASFSSTRWERGLSVIVNPTSSFRPSASAA